MSYLNPVCAKCIYGSIILTATGGIREAIPPTGQCPGGCRYIKIYVDPAVPESDFSGEIIMLGDGR